jgi:hypothetical protein
MKRLLLAVASIGLIGIGLTPNVRADAWDKKTTMTVTEAIQVPNKVLPPGTYVVKLVDSLSDRHIVQIFNADETELQTTILAIPNYRLKRTGKSVFTFWEMPPGQPTALRAWFYPGDNFGQEFAYPKTKAATIASVSHAEVPTVEAETIAELPTAPIAKLPELIAEAPPISAPVPAPVAAAPEVAQEIPTAPAELPKTASPYPLIGLAGMLSLLVYGVVHVVRTS